MKSRAWRRIQRAAALLLCAVFLIASMPAGLAEASSKRRVVRVAFPSQSGMSEVDDGGDLVGYNYQYLQKLAEYTGWEMDYITFENMSANDGIMSAMQMVLSGEADLLGPMLKSEAVEEMFDFPQDNYGVVYTTLCALEKSELTSVNFVKCDPLRVAVFESATTRNQEVSEYLTQQKINFELIPCESSEAQLETLEKGKADVLSSITLSYFPGTRSVAQFAPRPYYFVTTKGETELLQELDAATEALNYTRPYFQEQLQEEFFGDTSSGYVLTEDETKTMDALKTLNVLCVSGKEAPYVIERDDGTAEGMLVSMMNDFAKKNDLEITYTFCDDPGNARSYWLTGKYDCAMGAPFSSEYCAANGLIRTEAVTTVEMVLFAKQQTSIPLSEGTVAVYDRLADQVNLSGVGMVLPLSTPKECYDAVEDGRADYGCSDRLSVEYQLFERDSQMVTVPLLGNQEEISLAVARDMGDEFLSALNKFIHTLSDSAKTTYLSEGSRHETGNGFAYFVRTQPLAASGLLAAIAVLIFCSVIFASNARRNKRRNIELQKANSAKSDFLSRMSHDIRTPMNAIIGYLTIARDPDNSPEKVRHCIDNSATAARNLLQLINDVLDMSSIESGKMKVANEPFDLKKEIMDVTTIFYQTGRSKGVRYETQLDGLIDEWVVGDQLRINQVLTNLLSNAVKFTPKGGMVKLRVHQEKSDDASKQTEIRFVISDTGIGMSEEYMTRMFLPFEQEEASTARKYGGSGLGLSIAHNLVEMMGGTILAESKQNEGTTFTVTMRFDKMEPPAVNPVALDRVRALIVSDQEITEQVKERIEACGAKADTVDSAAYALKRIIRREASDYPYDLCIVDWDRDAIDGESLTKQIREAIPRKGLMLVAAAYDLAEHGDAAKQAGANQILAKPLFLSTLRDMLMQAGGLKHDSSKTMPAPGRIDMTGTHVLLAEDNAMNMEIAVTVLGKAGIQVDQAVNGQEACRLFTDSPEGTYDFILMDVQMPVMNGYEATKAIRSAKRKDAATIPIIAMTANAFAEDVKTALQNGMNAHIAKPVNYDKLFSVLQEMQAAKK